MLSIYLYLLFLTFAFCIIYFFIYAFFPYLFTGKLAAGKVSWCSVFVIFFVSFFFHAVSLSISYGELGNRVLHTFGGGFLGVLVCFLALRDAGLLLRKFQFLSVTFLLVTTLGVGNEILEAILQNTFGFEAAPNINDTWFDLMSNTAGILIAALCFTPFVPVREKGKLS